MTPEQLERLAASGEELPEGLELPEQLYYLTLRELYSNYHNGIVNKDRAKREKSRINVAYRNLTAEYEITRQHKAINNRLSKHIGELYQCGCPNCRKLINIFTGINRQDIPDEIKEVNALNERLRELVRERSERNVELATIIDRARWALEKGDFKSAKEMLNDYRNN